MVGALTRKILWTLSESNCSWNSFSEDRVILIVQLWKLLFCDEEQSCTKLINVLEFEK